MMLRQCNYVRQLTKYLIDPEYPKAQHSKTFFKLYWALLMVSLPRFSTPMIQVHISLKSTIFFFLISKFEANDKQKRAGLAKCWVLSREHQLQGKYHCMAVWIQLLCMCGISNSFTCLVESKPVKQKVSRTVILRPMVSVIIRSVQA